MAALAFWLAGDSQKDKAWLRCSTNALGSLLGMRDTRSLETCGWDSNSAGGDKGLDYPTDWEPGHLEFGDKNYTVELDGTSCLSEFEFEVRITPSVSKQETGACGEDCSVPVDPATLPIEALVGIARYAQSMLFLALVPSGPHRVVDVWTLDKDVSGADFIEQMTRELDKHGLVPEAGSLS